MTRLARAAMTFANEVRAIDDDAIILKADLDGLNIYRSLQFDPNVAAWLEPVALLTRDQRIVSIQRGEAGSLTVTFSPRVVGDSIVPFNLADFKTIHDAAAEARLAEEARPAKKVSSSKRRSRPE